ncbi:MAG: hypothetical protein ACREJ3_04625, partial [Polyangiaceae bacterium]
MTVRPSFTRALALIFASSAFACARAHAPDSSAPAPGPTPAAASARSQASAPAPVPAQAIAAPPAPLEGEDFIAQARTLFRVAACGPTGEVPPRFDAAVVARHCDALNAAYAEYKKSWVDLATPFIASLRPKDLPSTVVYPFGGGDLTTALATFPDATEITTISLEPAGDVRSVDHLSADHLARELATHRAHLERLFAKAHSRTDNLDKEAKAGLPGEVVFALAALAVYGDEPVSLRYFHLRPDGSLDYVTQADIAADARKPSAMRELFENAELRFRSSGTQDGGAAGDGVRVLRHIAFNLDDEHLKSDGVLLAYLNSLGKVSAMTK